MRLLLTAALIAAATLGGCGEQRPSPSPAPSSASEPAAEPRPARAERPRPKLPPRLSCPEAAANCVSVRGRILYVEEIDPDGDGDAHFALASEEGVTLPGVTVVDVRADLRPDPLPRPGDYLSAVGPVYPGSYGQAQVEATEIAYRAQG